MDYRVIFGVLFVVLAVQAAPTDDVPDKAREGISHGPLLLNDEDRAALLRVTEQATHINKPVPEEETHTILAGLLNSAETAANVLERVMGNVQDHEEKSHRTIDELQTRDPDTTDICVRNVFGTPTRRNPIYCGVKFFSQVALQLYEISQTVVPLNETVQKLSADLAKCTNSTGFSEKFICSSQAYRNCWENSEFFRAKLGQHLTLTRSLIIEINECIKNNHQIQSHLVNKVAECTQANK